MAVWLAAAALIAIACKNVTGLAEQPRATFSQLACLDRNGDFRIDAADAADMSTLPDFNADRSRNDEDAAFLRGVGIQLDPQRASDACKGDTPEGPEYAVAHGYFDPAEVSCDKRGGRAVLLVGVGGGVVNIKDKADAAGIRQIVDALQRKLDDSGVQTIAVLAGPALIGGQNIHSAMEQWMSHAVQVYLDRYPCLRALLIGHSHGAITVDVIAAKLEDRYADRFIGVVDVDRVETLYIGDLRSRPTRVPEFNIYETNDARGQGKPYDSPNVEDWDASGEQGPSNGQNGGPLEPVNHTTIDNSKSVRDRIVQWAMSAAGYASATPVGAP